MVSILKLSTKYPLSHNIIILLKNPSGTIINSFKSHEMKAKVEMTLQSHWIEFMGISRKVCTSRGVDGRFGYVYCLFWVIG